MAGVIFHHLAHLVPCRGRPGYSPDLLLEVPPPALSYIVGTLGTVISVDLTNLGNLQRLGAPVASIGGAGTFDGKIFLTGIMAVLLASLMSPK